LSAANLRALNTRTGM
jgi:hypothetical protein